MAHQNPRVNLTLPQDIYDMLGRMSAVTGQPRATIVRELLIDAKPHLDVIIQALILAKQEKLEAMESLVPTLERLSNEAKDLGQSFRDKTREARAHLRLVPKDKPDD
jgi:chemotaxis regulatin CheY-phosphate phosphatase CheZ